MRSCRLLPFAILDGPSNMAADEAMLIAADQGIASLRFYAWDVPTLSLGYFQSAGDRLADPLLAGANWLRRSSGGGAILHHRELTYCVAIPAGWQGRGSWICRVHHLVETTLADLGVQSRAVVCGEEKKLGPFLCFQHQTAGDLLIEGHKVAGSAQRKLRGALMQHGSILLERSPIAPVLPGIKELSGKSIEAESLAERLTNAFRKEFDWEWGDASFDQSDRLLIDRIVAEKYGTSAWNDKR